MLQNSLSFVRLLAYGKAAWIILAKDKKTKKLFALKLEKVRSTRVKMVEKEAKHLTIANAYNIGQKLIKYDLNARVLMWEYVEALPLKEWIKTADKKKINVLVKELLKQSRLLDDIGLDHGQLAGDATNILVKKSGTPVIVDFEKGSDSRKPHNYNVMINFLFKNKNPVSEKIKELGITLN